MIKKLFFRNSQVIEKWFSHNKASKKIVKHQKLLSKQFLKKYENR